MEQPLSPRDFVKRYSLPQLVRIHNAHLHQLNTHRVSNKAIIKSNENSNHSGSLESGSSSSDAKKQEKKKASTVGKLSSKHLIKRSSDANEGVNDVNLLDIDQPFLLYKSYTSRQITAHTLTPDSSCDTANYKKTGPGLLIPENYPGWFSVVTSKGQTAGYFVTMDEVTRAQVPYFLTRDDLSAFAIPRNAALDDTGKGAPFPHHPHHPHHHHSNYDPYHPYHHDPYHHHHHLDPYHQIKHSRSASSPIVATPNGCYDRTVVPGGTVLRFLGVYEDVSAFILGASNLFGSGKGSVKKHSMRNKSIKNSTLNYLNEGQRYAKCVAFNSNFFTKLRSEDAINSGEVVFVPINEVGRFYVVSKRGGASVSYNHVYSLAHLLRVIKLPATVQLVVGPKPRNYWPESTSDAVPYHSDYRYLFDKKAPKNGYFGSFSRKNSSAGRHHSKSLSDATFTAVLRLEDIRVREVILASTIRPSPFSVAINPVQRSSSSLSSSIRRTLRGGTINKLKSLANMASSKEDKEAPVLLEFDLDSSFSFVRTFNERVGTLTSRKIPELVLDRIEYCNQEGDNWKRQIKIAHDIIPRQNDKILSEHAHMNVSGSNDSGCSSGNNSNPEEAPLSRFVSSTNLASGRLPLNQVVKQRPSIFDHPEVFKSSTNLRDANLLDANLSDAKLCDAKFSKRYQSKFGSSNLNLSNANSRLDRHFMIKSNSDHNLKIDAKFGDANFRDANFRDANIRNASIASKASNISNTSRLSKLLTRFWNPLKKGREPDQLMEEEERSDYDDAMIEDAFNEDDREPSIFPENKMAAISDDEDETPPSGMVPPSGMKSRRHRSRVKDGDDDHVYETLKRSDSDHARINQTLERRSNGVCKSKSTIDKLNQSCDQRPNDYHDGRQRISRKATLDAIFPDVIKIDDNGYLSKSCPGGANSIEDNADYHGSVDQVSVDAIETPRNETNIDDDFDRDMECFEDIEHHHKIVPKKAPRKAPRKSLPRPPLPPPPPSMPRASLASERAAIKKSNSSFSISNREKFSSDHVITSAL